MVSKVIVKGQKINDRYQIIRMIGEGGMANVYLAYDTILNRNVAVKILRGDLAEDEKFVRRFQREAISASSLSHPNIVEMYDVGEDQGKYFIVMEYLEGKTLKSLLKKRVRLTMPEVIDIMLQLTSGLACAHESYIIHRDIKPQNIIILEDGSVKITDFGIAMALNSNELTQTNSVMGSVHYLPPEQANGEGSTIKSDIYSLGILMYELITGTIPFKGENAVEIALKHMKENIPNLTDFDPEIPQAVENIILKACAKNPKNRYDSILDMRDDIRTCLDEEKKNEKKVVYNYPEQELEETKIMPNLKELRKRRDDSELLELEKEEKSGKIANVILIIVISIVLFLIGLFVVLMAVGTKNTANVKIPDLKNETLEEAEAQLKELGFSITYEERNSEVIEKGFVISTDPSASAKKGSSIKIIVSKGTSSVVLENYVGKDYYEVEAALTAKGIKVVPEKKDVEKTEDLKDNVILDQSLEAGTVLKEGNQLILYIPNAVDTYPDFIGENYTMEEIQEFCDEKELTLVIVENKNSSEPEGTILKQSKVAGTKVVANQTLKITVSKPVTTTTTKTTTTTTTKPITTTTTKPVLEKDE